MVRWLFQLSVLRLPWEEPQTPPISVCIRHRAGCPSGPYSFVLQLRTSALKVRQGFFQQSASRAHGPGLAIRWVSSHTLLLWWWAVWGVQRVTIFQCLDHHNVFAP